MSNLLLIDCEACAQVVEPLPRLGVIKIRNISLLLSDIQPQLSY